MPGNESLLIAAPLLIAAIVMAFRFVGCGIDADPIPGPWNDDGDGEDGKPQAVAANFTGHGVLMATAGFPGNDPKQTPFTEPGTVDYPIPYWCDTIDLILLGAGGGGSAAEISSALRLVLVFLAAGALGAGGGASETTTRAALRLAPRPRRGGAGAGLLDEGFLLGFLMGVQSTIFGPEGVYSTVWLRRPGGVACERIVFVFVFMTRTRALPGTNVAHLVMEKGGSPCSTGYGLRGSNRTQSGDGG